MKMNPNRKARREVDVDGEKRTLERSFNSPEVEASDFTPEQIAKFRNALGWDATEQDVLDAISNGFYLFINPKVAADMMSQYVAPSPTAVKNALIRKLATATPEQAIELAKVIGKVTDKASAASVWKQYLKGEEV